MIKLKKLVDEGDLSPKAAERMGAIWVSNADELYCLIRSTLKHGTEGMRDELARNIEIPKGKLIDYMNYIKPYVSNQVINPDTSQDHPTGCLITDEQMARINWINSLNSEEYEEWQDGLREEFYRSHPKYAK
tara:strand:+ start:128 stop:523 length:396 start_codon:yes stop_codon:yes gene_type:complete